MVTPVTTDVRSRVEGMVAETTLAAGRDPEFWPPLDLDRFHARAALLSAAHAFRSPFYQRKFAGLAPPSDMAEFRRLPLTRPGEVKGRFRELLACPWEEVAQLNMSSGTTAGPTTYVAYTEADLRGDGAHYAPGGLFGFDPEDLVFVALPYDMATVGFSIHRDVRRQRAAVLPAGKGGTYSSPARLTQAIAELAPTRLFSTPSYAWHLAELFAATYPDRPRSLPWLHVGGEGASAAMLAGLGRLWGAQVRQWYGSTEIGIIAYSCEHGCYHLTAANCLLEILDADGQPVPAGRPGSVVLTPLGRVATPLVRYDTGDMAMLAASPCACGRTLPGVRLLGRSADLVPTTGRPVSPYALEQVLLTVLPAASPWYHVALRDSGVVLVAEWPDAVDPARRDAIAARLYTEIFEAVSLDLAAVDWAEPGTLDRPHTKMRRIHDERRG